MSAGQAPKKLEASDRLLAHCFGLCDLCYHPSGAYLITGGADGQVKLIRSTDRECFGTLDCDKEITAIAVSTDGTKLYVATEEDKAIRSYKLPAVQAFLGKKDEDSLELEIEFDAIVFRATTQIFQMVATQDYLFVCGSFPTVQMIKLEDYSVHKVFKPVGSSVGSAFYGSAFDPKNIYLATTSDDGKARVWKLADKEIVSVFDYVDAADRVADGPFGRLAWSGDGKLLALPGRGAIDVRSRDSWGKSFKLEDSHVGITTLAAWSPNSLYLASAGTDKRVVIWDTVARSPIDMYELDNDICALHWSPTANELAIVDYDGKYSVLKRVVPGSLASPVSFPDEGIQGAPRPTQAQSTTLASNKSQNPSTAATATSISAVDGKKESVGTVSRVSHTKNDADDSVVSVAAIKQSLGFSEDGEFQGAPIHSSEMDLSDHEDDGNGRGEDPDDNYLMTTRKTLMQASFQPGATKTAKNRKRILVWNTTGVIESVLHEAENGSSYSTVRIELSDQETFRPVRITDRYNFVMAALNEQGVVFASKYAPPANITEKAVQSTIYYRPLASWTANSEWTLQLREGEEAEVVAVNNECVAVATTRRFIRLFTTSGVQDGILFVPGPIVTMAGSGCLLAIVHHSAEPLEDTQSLRYQIISIPTRTEVCSGSLPTSAGSELSWMGFDDTGMLCAGDSTGLLYGLIPFAGWQWMPLLDAGLLKRNSFENFWFLGVALGKLLCVRLTNDDEPSIPRPVPTSLDIKIPLLQSDPATAPMERDALLKLLRVLSLKKIAEDGLVSNDISLDEIASLARQEEVDLDKLLLKMMQAACKKDRAAKALDLAARLNLPKSFDVALTVANHFQMDNLYEKVLALQQAREEQQSMLSIGRKSSDRYRTQKRERFYDDSRESVTPKRHRQESPSASPFALPRSRDTDPPGKENGSSIQRKEASSDVRETMPAVPVNPFSKKTMLSPVKRKSLSETLEDIKTSPSGPILKPKLNRDSSFSQKGV